MPAVATQPKNALDAAPWHAAAAGTETPDPFWTDEDDRLRFRPHAGQQKALDSTARFILVLAGLQSGKTITGPWWMMREMALRGPGDYLAAGPTFPLLKMKCLPEYEQLFVRRLGWGKLYKGYPPVLEINETGRRQLFARQIDAGMDFGDTETRIIFGAGIKPESLESATVKAAHLDEAGQGQFLRASHEAVLGRLSVHRGRILYTTTPYQLGWLESEVHDPAKKERALPPAQRTYELVQYASTMNPAFSEEEFAEMRRKMPGWKFRMRYRGQFERPAGMIYDIFDEDRHVCTPFKLPQAWPRKLGLDFGGVNTAGVFLAEERGERGRTTGHYFAYREYLEGGETAAGHASELLDGEPGVPDAWGGAPSETQWRNEFRAAGLPVSRPPVADIEVGIDRVYALLKQDRLTIFDDLPGLLNEVQSYSRVLDDNDEPTEKIENKEIFHRLDALRYVSAGITAEDDGGGWVAVKA